MGFQADGWLNPVFQQVFRYAGGSVLQSFNLSIRTNAPRAVVTLPPVFFTQIVDTDFATAGGGMDELVIAQINPHMGKRTSHGIEKDQITRLQLVLADDIPLMADVTRAPGSRVPTLRYTWVTKPLQSKPVSGVRPPRW